MNDAPMLTRRSRLAGIGMAFILAALPAWILSGCGRQAPTRSLDQGTLQLELQYAAGVAAPRGGPTPPYNAFDSLTVRVFAWDASPEAEPLAEAAIPLTATSRSFQLSFQVTPQPAYRVTAEVHGFRYRSPANNRTDVGLQLMGEERVELSSLARGPVIVTLQDIVPRVTIRRDSAGVALAWNPVSFATGYTVLGGPNLSLVVSNVPDPEFRTADQNLIGQPFRARAEFGPRLSGAYGEVVSVIAPPPFVSALVPDSVAAGRSTSLLLDIQGNSFVFGAGVTWDDTLLAATFLSSSALQATIPASRLAAAGAHAVIVLNPDGQASNTVGFQTVP